MKPYSYLDNQRLFRKLGKGVKEGNPIAMELYKKLEKKYQPTKFMQKYRDIMFCELREKARQGDMSALKKVGEMIKALNEKDSIKYSSKKKR